MKMMAMEIPDILLPLVSLITSLLFLYLAKNLFPYRPGRNSRLELPPGSRGWPVIGEVVDLKSKYKQGALHNFVLERCHKYSSKVFKTSFMGQPMVVLAGAEGNKFAFSNQKDLFKHFVPKWVEHILVDCNKILGDNDQRAEFRKFLRSILKGDALRHYLGIFDATMRQELQRDWNWEQKQATDHDRDRHRQKVIDQVGEMVRRYTFASECKIFFGMEDETKIDELQRSIELMVAGMVSIPINFPGTAFHRGIQAFKKFRKEIMEIIRDQSVTIMNASSSSSSKTGTDSLPPLVRSLLSSNNANICYEEITNVVTGILMGGFVGIQVVATNVFKHLADFAEFYDLVLKEQEEIARSKAANESLHLKDLMNMKYSWKFISEALRLTTNPGGFKEAITDFNYGGYTIPKGWKIHWNMDSTHRNPEYYSNPDKFDPSRFDGDGPAPFTYIPFGGGTHMCPGNEYAKFALLIFLHYLITSSVGKTAISAMK